MEPDARSQALIALGRSLQQDLAAVLDGGAWPLAGVAWDDLAALNQVAADWLAIELTVADLAALQAWLTTELLGGSSPESGVAGDRPASHPPGLPHRDIFPRSEAENVADFAPTFSAPVSVEQAPPPQGKSPTLAAPQHAAVAGWALPPPRELPGSQAPQHSAPVGWAPPPGREHPGPRRLEQSGDRDQPPRPTHPQPAAWADEDVDGGEIEPSREQGVPPASPPASVDHSAGSMAVVGGGAAVATAWADRAETRAVVGGAHPTGTDGVEVKAEEQISPRAGFMAPTVGGFSALAARLADSNRVGAPPAEPWPRGGAEPPQTIQPDWLTPIGATPDSPAVAPLAVGGWAELTARLTSPELPQTDPAEVAQPALIPKEQTIGAAILPKVREALSLAAPPATATSSSPGPNSAPDSTAPGASASAAGATTSPYPEQPADWFAAAPAPPTVWPEARSPDELDLDEIMDAIARTITRDYRRFYGP
ncbi:hypothetical protein PGN35_004080 [Nodosilinea sp. PGN35]|uniref:hypothetical protein n=1 Tax=Nodosilinea sp. PGN35 TaxID=3020489 RepID=UPI0023B3080F|nr:hypothetical protein [Nodosilinea sp. TSF1-S3]MDF0365798.1 hypothetical protein [Nodosilinea sp. TSF1-S3]